MDVHVAHGSHVREPEDARAGGTRLAPSRKTPSAHSPLRPDQSPVLTVVGPDSFLLRPHVLPLGLGEVRVLPSVLGPPQALGNILPAEEAPSGKARVLAHHDGGETRRPLAGLGPVYLSQDTHHCLPCVAAREPKLLHEVTIRHGLAPERSPQQLVAHLVPEDTRLRHPPRIKWFRI